MVIFSYAFLAKRKFKNMALCSFLGLFSLSSVHVLQDVKTLNSKSALVD